jgi:hypothetical protein
MQLQPLQFGTLVEFDTHHDDTDYTIQGTIAKDKGKSHVRVHVPGYDGSTDKYKVPRGNVRPL